MLSKVVIVVQRSVPYALKHASAHATVIHGGYSARLSPKTTHTLADERFRANFCLPFPSALL